jgi:hypothetical protein
MSLIERRKEKSPSYTLKYVCLVLPLPLRNIEQVQEGWQQRKLFWQRGGSHLQLGVFWDTHCVYPGYTPYTGKQKTDGRSQGSRIITHIKPSEIKTPS